MKKFFGIFLVIALILAVSIKAFSSEVKLGEGAIILDYVDSQTAAASATTPFNLGNVLDDPGLAHSFLSIDAVANDNVTGKVVLDLTGVHSADAKYLEEVYFTMNNLPGLPEGTELKGGLFYVPFGLGKFMGGKTLTATLNTSAFSDHMLDTGLQLSGATGGANYKLAYVNGVADNAKDLYLKITAPIKDITGGLSVYRGKAVATKLSATGIDFQYNANPMYSLEGEYIWAKSGTLKTNLMYAKGAYNFNEATSGSLAYYEVNPDTAGLKTAKTYVIGLENKYMENVALKLEYIVNKDLTGTATDAKDNVLKLETKVSF